MAAAAGGLATSSASSTQSNGNLRSQAVPCPQIQSQTFYKPLNSRRTSASNQRLCLKCESASQNLNSIHKEESKRSNVIALEQLKASAIDSEFSLFVEFWVSIMWNWITRTRAFYYVVQNGRFCSLQKSTFYLETWAWNLVEVLEFSFIREERDDNGGGDLSILQ